MDPTEVTLDALWDQARDRSIGAFDPKLLSDAPDPVRRYFEHAIAPGTPLARAVRVKMSGEVRLNGRWLPFDAEQVIRWDRGFVWKADVRMAPGIHIKGSDRLVDGTGALDWKALGFIPVMSASGPDIARSAVGRLELESLWLPSVLLDDDVRWTVEDAHHVRLAVHVAGDEGRIRLTLDDDGRVIDGVLPRWGNPEGANYHLVPFGVLAEEERTFEGYTIPTRFRAGWFYEDFERFEREGEFFRARFEDVKYR